MVPTGKRTAAQCHIASFPDSSDPPDPPTQNHFLHVRLLCTRFIDMNCDVIIAGGGVAGSAAAAVLSGFGYHVLVIEPGLDHARRLAGELIHPPGVAALQELGLLACLEQAGAVPVQGFAVLPGPYRLPYKEVPEFTMQGLAMDHATMAEAFLRAMRKLELVTLW